MKKRKKKLKNKGPVIYRVPQTGIYEVITNVVRFEPTGETDVVPNPNYKWYKPWVSKTVLVKRMKRVYDLYEKRVVALKANETVLSKVKPRKV